MAQIKPFKAVTFDPRRAGALGDVLCPPYDVISPEFQAKLHDRSPYNVVRLELGAVRPEDRPGDDRYTRARAVFEDWQASGILRHDPEPALYVYEQAWGDRKRMSFFAAVRLAPWSDGEVLPHEQTLSGPKVDRLELMRHTGANLSPIMGLYEDPDGAVAATLDVARATPPLLEATTSDAPDSSSAVIGDRHRIWKLSHSDDLAAIERVIAARPVFIADGHHRYETALTYRDERRRTQGSHTGQEPWNYVLMSLSSMQDPGLLVLPTHRLVRAPGLSPQALLSRLSRSFSVDLLEPSGATTAAETADWLVGSNERKTIGMVVAGCDTLYRLTLTVEPATALAHLGRSQAWCDLQVAQLHYLVMAEVLGIPESDWKGGERIVYTRDAHEALARVRSHEFDAAFFLGGTPVEHIQKVSVTGEVMPQKSTYFYPKLPTGLLIHALEPASERVAIV
ncbi:MAG: DUF1015 family protein [Cyanobacteria bacterium REEB65]|nr:DUF1015 family protein [Cyanobacteria bacterium REEB65]